MTWTELNKKLKTMDEKTAATLCNEYMKAGRKTFALRAHMRYSKMRRQRERKELMAGTLRVKV